ncbi:hypothetical protein AMATHDRAFT_87111 [Amanita thiersii Skay4041]|uniref:Uncharacterized protein n=1 Tax=Amanita thiersii Skay4041 TaxID=703135 RepID=A0A2A9NJJ6_9AGAR|nr:hypothetical protein AMATHDRAFT_87111 [Amanita thiersii Skay4041]
MPYNPSSVRDEKEFAYLGEGRDVRGFCDMLQVLYTSPDTQDLSQDRWRIVEMRSYRNKTGKPDYEYIVATIRGPMHTQTVSSSSSSNSSPGRKPNSVLLRVYRKLPKSEMLTTGGYEFDLKTKKRPLDDVTLIRAQEVSQDSLVEAIVFQEGTYMTLAQFAVLARCVLDRPGILECPNDHWFAYTAMGVIKRLHTNHIQASESSKRRWRYSMSSQGENITDEPRFDTLLHLYNRQWRTFNQKVSQAINNSRSPLVREANEQREDAERRALEAERLMAEKDERIAELASKLARARRII